MNVHVTKDWSRCLTAEKERDEEERKDKKGRFREEEGGKQRGRHERENMSGNDVYIESRSSLHTIKSAILSPSSF